MRNMLLVIKREIVTTVQRRSFWFTTFLLPLLIFGFSVLPQLMAREAFDGAGDMLAQLNGDGGSVGYVDRAGLVSQLPDGVSPDKFRAYPDEGAALAALRGGEISRYYLIPADFLDTGGVVLVDSEFSPVSIEGGDLIEYVINANLLDDAGLASLVMRPVAQLGERALEPQQAAKPDMENPLAIVVPLAVMFILFFTITMSGGFMLQSVAKEKENRTVEVLLTSLQPLDLMMGKVIGLGALALFQMTVWMGGGLLILGGGFVFASFALGYTVPAGFFVWALCFFVLGYLLYASMLGALGALAPSMREGSQFTFVLLMPLMIPLWLNSVFLNASNSVLATILSLFPLSAPTSMLTRMAAGNVPGWQPFASLLGLAITTYLFVALSARFFRADSLLSSASLSWGRLKQEIWLRART